MKRFSLFLFIFLSSIVMSSAGMAGGVSSKTDYLPIRIIISEDAGATSNSAIVGYRLVLQGVPVGTTQTAPSGKLVSFDFMKEQDDWWSPFDSAETDSVSRLLYISKNVFQGLVAASQDQEAGVHLSFYFIPLTRQTRYIESYKLPGADDIGEHVWLDRPIRIAQGTEIVPNNDSSTLFQFTLSPSSTAATLNDDVRTSLQGTNDEFAAVPSASATFRGDPYTAALVFSNWETGGLKCKHSVCIGDHPGPHEYIDLEKPVDPDAIVENFQFAHP